MKNPKSIRSLFSLPGFVAASQLVGFFGDRYARGIVLRRRKKLRSARSVVTVAMAVTTSAPAAPATYLPAGFASTSSSSAGGSAARGVAAMIERHWNGIASYCRPENKVSLGLVEGLNNKIRVLQRRAYGHRDEEYLKIIAAFLHPLTWSAEKNPL